MNIKDIRIKEVFLAGMITVIISVCLWDFLMPSQKIYEAEDAQVVGAPVESQHSGYTGSGYVDFKRKSGEYVQWTVGVKQGGDYFLCFRYALGGKNDRPLRIIVNGEIMEEALNFPRTGDWSEWGRLVLEVYLEPGENAIRAVTSGNSGPNIDRLSVEPVKNRIFSFLGKV